MVEDQKVKGLRVVRVRGVRGLGLVGDQAPPPRHLIPTTPYSPPLDPQPLTPNSYHP